MSFRFKINYALSNSNFITNLKRLMTMCSNRLAIFKFIDHNVDISRAIQRPRRTT